MAMLCSSQQDEAQGTQLDYGRSKNGHAAHLTCSTMAPIDASQVPQQSRSQLWLWLQGYYKVCVTTPDDQACTQAACTPSPLVNNSNEARADDVSSEAML